jgi:hypothetical protein
VGKPEGRRRWVDNIKIGLRQDEVVWTGMIWIRIGTSGSSCLVLVGTLAVDLLSTGAAEATFDL